MSEAFDIYTLLFLVLAVVIFIRLRNVLGRRTGNERPPYDPYTTADAKRPTPPDANEPVVALPRARPAHGRRARRRSPRLRISRRGLAAMLPRTARSGNRSPL